MFFSHCPKILCVTGVLVKIKPISTYSFKIHPKHITIKHMKNNLLPNIL